MAQGRVPANFYDDAWKYVFACKFTQSHFHNAIPLAVAAAREVVPPPRFIRQVEYLVLDLTVIVLIVTVLDCKFFFRAPTPVNVFVSVYVLCRDPSVEIDIDLTQGHPGCSPGQGWGATGGEDDDDGGEDDGGAVDDNANGRRTLSVFIWDVCGFQFQLRKPRRALVARRPRAKFCLSWRGGRLGSELRLRRCQGHGLS